MTKLLRGRGNAPPFFGPANEHPFKDEQSSSNSASQLVKAGVSRRRSPSKSKSARFIDGIVGGERVLLATPKESERGIEFRTRVALTAAGALVMKHTVEVCHRCRQRPSQRTGLGTGASDLICVVPPYGRFLGIEMKKPGYSPSDVRPDQHCWLAVIRRFGGITGIATSPEEALALVEKARRLT